MPGMTPKTANRETFGLSYVSRWCHFLNKIHMKQRLPWFSVSMVTYVSINYRDKNEWDVNEIVFKLLILSVAATPACGSRVSMVLWELTYAVVLYGDYNKWMRDGEACLRSTKDKA